jgi:hypothetical protein
MIWTFISTKKITRSQKTNPGFKNQIHFFSVIAHIHKYVTFMTAIYYFYQVDPIDHIGQGNNLNNYNNQVCFNLK